MYATIVRSIAQRGFNALNTGNYDQLLRQFHAQIQFAFGGPTPFGGERSGIAAVREWFQLLFATFPGIQITPRQMLVKGWPWNTQVATRLAIRAPRQDGSWYENEGMQFLRVRWGKIVEDRVYEDTYKLAQELQQRLSHVEPR